MFLQTKINLNLDFWYELATQACLLIHLSRNTRFFDIYKQLRQVEQNCRYFGTKLLEKKNSLEKTQIFNSGTLAIKKNQNAISNNFTFCKN